MKYFLDTEFIEGFHKPMFGKNRHFIDLISIGVVREDGKSYYAISTDFKNKDADPWVLANVIATLPKRKVNRNPQGGDSPRVIEESLLWKSNEQIKYDLLNFFGCYQDHLFWRAPPGIEVYAYYADYDWVLFCSLFGRMIDLPKGFPMYCIDLKQTLDEKVDGLTNSDFLTHFHVEKQLTFDEKLELIKKKNFRYPTQETEHNAIADAKWNLELYKFLQTI
jgi:hypothetical protein